MKTNAGNDWQASIMGNSAATGAGTGTQRPADYIALTTDATAPAAGDTTLASELTANGLQRQQATYAHTTGAATYTLSKTFTSTDPTARTINKIAVFNAAAAGTMVFETLLPSPPTLVSGDTLTITETVNL
jgi:hypothetical protein